MPKVVDHQQMRSAILEASYRLFAENDYASVTMQRVAEALGVSTGTLYHYFPTKQAIFRALVEAVTDAEFDRATSVAAAANDPQSRLAAYITFLQANERSFQTNLLIMASVYRYRDELLTEDLLCRLGEKYREKIAAFIGSNDPELIQFVFSFFTGLIVQRMIFGEEVSFKGQTAYLLTMLGKAVPSSELNR
jgi:AcrR family transcriptional regulator